MIKQDRLLRKIANKEKITLSFGCDKIKVFALSLTLIYLTLSFSILYIFYFNFKTLTLLSIPFFIYLFLMLQLKKYVSASIIGEMLLSESLFKKNKITSLKSIKKLSSNTFFNYEITKIIYKLDGNTLVIRFINKIDREHLRAEEIIKTILKEVA